ncbi:VOC family protein [Pararhodonellum marinum]|uniref:VOC family protein n=1 Tax=Pararhodonellum marinum TaxID=2755358 RepID=UPI00188F9458|nr:VOC family protein [Pararhodonellum marinum]
MKKSVQPYLHFDENCREAMQYYQSLFGGDLELMSIGESPSKEEFPSKLHHQIMHASLINEDFNLMASDMCGQGPLHQGNSVQLSLDCSSEDEINKLYQQMIDGGKVEQELGEQFWGALFAMVIDKFGVRWMLSYDKNQHETG